ncbi:MAG: DNA repair protein RecO [Ruminococcaceae bacterium]|nr:DNA repair protein RecO [Oscillospiraceae bacterium]
MKITEKGLVLKEVKLRESDRILTLLTAGHGVISASARGSLRPGNKLFSASGLFCYSEFVLHEGKTMYTVDEASPIEVFFGLRQSLEAVSLAAYIADIVQILSPTGAEAEKLLRLALNSLHMLSLEKRSPAFVKAVFELRALAESGYLPNLLACGNCGKYEEATFFFDAGQGTLLCGSCAGEAEKTPNLNAAALSALRHIALADDARLFNFELGPESLALLARATEQYLLFHLDYPPKTLAFLKTVL